MHIPDGFLDTKTIVATSLLSAAGVGRALHDIKQKLPSRKMPLMGLSAAFIFVAQMVNFPVAGGTSGHLVGAVLASILLGPAAAIVIMCVVLVSQCFLFADGGVLSLGANIFNMGIVATVSGYTVYRLISGVIKAEYGMFLAAGFAAWFSTVLAAIVCTGELAWSGTVPFATGFPAMAGIHMLIGVGEAVITMLVCAAVYKARPDIIFISGSRKDAYELTLGKLIIYGSLVILGMILFILPFASKLPDGLEKVAASMGFQSRQITHSLVHAPIADYRIPGIGSLTVATGLAGLVGAVIVFALCFFIARVMFPPLRKQEPQAPDAA
jgi:cobalt/nickel transport system permease protein